MSYQVIARKYRPQTFADLTGQEHINRTLCNALENNRLHHAYLFSGVRGTGKTTTARILAKCLNCITGVTSTPCLQCPSCLEIATGGALDVIEIDAASNTGVDNVREVIVNSISISPARDRYKVFIIDEVHMLSNQAFNALLKTLEEPPSHVIFMMATTELHKVPDTILSRCQKFEFRQIPVDKIFKRLREIATAEKVNITDEALHEVARAGNGSLRDAQSAFDQVIAFSGDQISESEVINSLGLVSTKTLGQAITAIATQDTAGLLNIVNELDSSGHDLRYFTRELMTYFRHLLVIKAGLSSPDHLGISAPEIGNLSKLATQFSEEDLVRFFHLLTDTEKQIKDSPHPRFQLEIGLVKLTQALRLRSLSEVIQRLEQLEAKLTGGSYSPPNVTSKNQTNPTIAVTQPRTSTLNTQPPTASVRTAAPQFEEPPGFGDAFNEDIRAGSNYIAESAKTSVLATKTAPVTRPFIASGREIAAIRMELEKRRKALVVMALEEAKVDYEDGTLKILFTAENVFSKRIREGAQLFNEIGEHLFGHPLRVEIKIGGEAVSSPIQETKQVRENMIESVKNNPAIKALLETFRGEIIEVKELA